MGILQPISQGPGYLRAGFLGFGASGKTWTAVTLALGVREMFDLNGPIAMADSEGGSDYVRHRVKKATGLDLMGVKTRSFDKMLETARAARDEGAAVFIVDSVTHYFRELQESYLHRVDEYRQKNKRGRKLEMELYDWQKVKALWAPWLDLFLNAPMHVIICGRAGFEWDMKEEEGTGKKKLQKTGVKMKGESEMAYEPSLLVEMQAVQDANRDGGLVHRATIIKDRFDEIDAATCDNPTFEFFLPHVTLLKPDAHTVIDTTPSTPNVDDEGNDDWHREKRLREMLCEDIKDDLTLRWPSQSADDKRAKIAILRYVFETGSWTAIESKSSDTLKLGRDRMREVMSDDGLLKEVLG